MKCKEKVASLFIPKNTPYCYTPKRPLKNGMGYKVKKCPFWKWKYCEEYGDFMEYCTFLKQFLDIQFYFDTFPFFD